jgi:mRNA interferase HigB
MRFVELLNQTALDQAIRKHPDAKKWLSQWSQVVQSASWQNLHDIRRNYPSADGVKLMSKAVVTVFNVKGNTYRLLTFVDYAMQRVYVAVVLTHAQYDKNQWKAQL